MKFLCSEVNVIVLGTLEELNKAAADVFDFGKLAGSPSTPPHGLSVKTFLTTLVETRKRSRSLSRRGSAATTV